MPDLRVIEGGGRSPNKKGVAAIVAVALAGTAMAYLSTRIGGDAPEIECIFAGQRVVAAQKGWGVYDLAIQVEGIDVAGPLSQCLEQAKSNIITRNQLDPYNPMLRQGQPYKIPRSLAGGVGNVNP